MTVLTKQAMTFALSLALGATTVGCGLIVGSGDYVIGDAGGSGSGSDASQTAPTDGGGGGGHPGSDGSTTSDGGSPGGDDSGSDAETANEGGSTSVDAGPIVSCDTNGNAVLGPGANSADFQKLINTCVQAVNCDPQLFAVTMSDCISKDYLQAVGSVACLETIQDCNGFYDCTGMRIATTTECPDVLDATESTGSCSANVATSCVAGSVVSSSVQNCDKLGGTCAVHSDGNGGHVADCKVVTSCSQTDGDLHCSGSDLYTCDNSAGYGQDCNLGTSSTCMDLSEGTLCYYDGVACANAGSTCGGNVLTSCDGETSEEFSYNCARAGLSCSDTASLTACLAPDCTPTTASNCTESCGSDGVTAEICVGGAQFPIDCTKYGFTSCDEDDFDGYVFCTY